MADKLHFLLVDDDKSSIDVHTAILEKAGHKVTALSNSEKAYQTILDIQPDCVLCDLVMPNLDGLDILEKLGKIPLTKKPIFIIVTSKVFEYDKREAINKGVDGYLTKPVNPDTFVDEVLKIVNGNMVIDFWGVRGTLPVPGPLTLRYGGNTNCVSVKFSEQHFFIFDAGTGIKELSNHLIKENKFPLSAKIFISHPHYDHINGIPFFLPLYMQGNEFEIIGTHHSGLSIEELISNQMDSVYFPITIKEFGAKLTFRNLNEEAIKIGDIEIRTILLNHPGRCLGFRVKYKNRDFCYLTDNEIYIEGSPHFNQFEVDRLIDFVKDVDILVIDCTYTDLDYKKKTGWGHSCTSRVIDIADKGKVKLLCLYHHDPDQMDADIDKKLQHAILLLQERNSSTICIAPKEGEQIVL